MIRSTASFAVVALFCATASTLHAQDRQPPAASPPAPPPQWPAAGTGTLPGNRITGIETNREMIAAEAPTEIVINGTTGAQCGVAIDFGDGSRATHPVTASAPFPLRLSHTYPKMADHTIRVVGAAHAGLPPCEGTADVAIRVAPAGSKIEYVTLSINTCPEGWSLVGQVSPDKSFKCAPIPDKSAPTNLIHCTDGMKYFARGGNVGCAHPTAAATPAVAAAPAPTPKRGTKGPLPAKPDAPVAANPKASAAPASPKPAPQKSAPAAKKTAAATAADAKKPAAATAAEPKK